MEGDLSQLLEANGSLSYTDKMYLAMAMAQLGDKAGATRVYNELVRPNIRTVSDLAGE